MAPEPKKLSQVFKTVGLPPYTYVKPRHYGEIRADVEQPGKHVLIEGPSGIGKTCVVYKVLEELRWELGREYQYVSVRDAGAEAKIEEHLSAIDANKQTGVSLYIIDDFHLLSNERRAKIGSRLKRISDMAFETKHPPKFALIGIPTAGTSLLSEAKDLGPRIGVYRFKTAEDNEIARLISEGEQALNVIFQDQELILAEASGNFWLAQYICNKVCAVSDAIETSPDVRILSFDILSIRRRLMDELSVKYDPTAKGFCKGKRWRPGGNKPYLEVFVALSKIPELVVSLDKVLSVVPERRRPGIKAIGPRIASVICDGSGQDLRKQIFFDEGSFSIEDPLFRYYLNNLDVGSLYKSLGLEVDAVERNYSYDVGFSFAGEARALVELVNRELKDQDVVTFYDFDVQAFLMAMDLEQVLRKVYSDSCKYYLVFLDDNYTKKVWTRFERDIMTTNSRKNHIIPVILDDAGKAVVGVPGTIGHVDLREVWSRVLASGGIAADDVNLVRNRCVLPLLERIGAAQEHVL